MSAEAVLCTHKTASSASLVLEICPSVQQPISQPILIHFWWELYHCSSCCHHPMECKPTPPLEEMDPNRLGNNNVNTSNDSATESASSSSNSCYSDDEKETENETNKQ